MCDASEHEVSEGSAPASGGRPRSADAPAAEAGSGAEFASAGARFDRAALGFNRHANVAERYRVAVDAFRAARATFERGTAERAALREARIATALHRDALQVAVIDLVRLLRDAGAPPERALVAVKLRLAAATTSETPGAPSLDGAMLERDASLWAIKAYYEAA